jgi:rfaE bifunctional protein kinase chain/domain
MLLPALAPDRAQSLVAGLAGARVLVVGDAMLDRFLAGAVTRISPEAPVPIVRFTHETHRLGGAANVAHNIAALGGLPTLVAVSGRDEAAATVAAACRAAGITPVLVGAADRPTTTKVRIVTERNQQVARVDYEHDAEIAGSIEAQVVTAVRTHASGADAIVVSDYLKGVVTPGVMAAVLAVAGARGVPVLVDPKIPHLDSYRGATLVTPNHHEAEIATHLRVRTDEDARAAARAFRTRAGCDGVLITRGDQGMWLLAPDAEGTLHAAAREVADVTGAGDTVIATLALSLAAGSTLTEAAYLANEAAGIAVGRFGPATVRAAELLDAIAHRAAR